MSTATISAPARTSSAANGHLQFHWNDAEFVYAPFPFGVIANVMDAGFYRQLVAEWPPTELFVFKENLGKKYSLSEVNNGEGYLRFLRTNRVWGEFYRRLKSPEFVREVLQVLQSQNIDLGLAGKHIATVHALSTVGEKLSGAMTKLARLRGTEASLSSRFEFSMLPASGGNIKPHTDAPQKLVTLVFSMLDDHEWRQEWGGGTAMLRTNEPALAFNHMNKQADFNRFEPVSVVEFVPNQCLIFIKTFNSWHTVYPMTGPADAPMRRTLTINIERWGG